MHKETNRPTEKYETKTETEKTVSEIEMEKERAGGKEIMTCLK